ncbi:hypothetical protein [Fibrobacter sp.]|uniref:hypothetical protein n=1 Tax=Fibrobacter sp. TaxID=35828 RepID=UPI00388D725C
MLMSLVNYFKRKPEFAKYDEDWKADMASYAYERCITGLKTIDVSRNNMYAYFFTTVLRSFITIIKRRYNKYNRHQKYLESRICDFLTVCEENGISIPPEKKRKMLMDKIVVDFA